MKYKYNFLDNQEINCLKGEKFWCNVCDGFLVDSEKKETGQFFQVFGHIRNVRQSEEIGKFEQLIFAICYDCLSKTREEIF